MFLTPHTTVAIALTGSTGNPVLAFLIGWVSHFLLDLIPHGDEGLNAWVERSRLSRTKLLFIVALVDSLVAGTFFVLFWLSLPSFSFSVAFWAALGSVLPDVLWGFAELLPQSKILEWYKQKHHSFQESIRDPLSLKWGAVIQLVVFFVSVWFVLF